MAIEHLQQCHNTSYYFSSNCHSWSRRWRCTSTETCRKYAPKLCTINTVHLVGIKKVSDICLCIMLLTGRVWSQHSRARDRWLCDCYWLWRIYNANLSGWGLWTRTERRMTVWETVMFMVRVATSIYSDRNSIRQLTQCGRIRLEKCHSVDQLSTLCGIRGCV